MSFASILRRVSCMDIAQSGVHRKNENSPRVSTESTRRDKL